MCLEFSNDPRNFGISLEHNICLCLELLKPANSLLTLVLTDFRPVPFLCSVVKLGDTNPDRDDEEVSDHESKNSACDASSCCQESIHHVS
jgi:hypothetical protein